MFALTKQMPIDEYIRGSTSDLWKPIKIVIKLFEQLPYSGQTDRIINDKKSSSF